MTERDVMKIDLPQAALPCPFCGCDDHPYFSNRNAGGTRAWACCSDCGASGPMGKDEDSAVARWNDRTALRAALAQPEPDMPPWEDRHDEWTEACEEAHPMNAGSGEHWETAMKMVGNRHSKYALVGLVAWLLHLVHSGPPRFPTAQPEPQGEPVAWSPALNYPGYENQRVWANGKPRPEDAAYWEKNGNGVTYAYTRPQRDLSDEEIVTMYDEMVNRSAPEKRVIDFARAILAARKA